MASLDQYEELTASLIFDLTHPTSIFFQAEDGIRDCLLSRGLGDVYKRQLVYTCVERTVVHHTGLDFF